MQWKCRIPRVRYKDKEIEKQATVLDSNDNIIKQKTFDAGENFMFITISEDMEAKLVIKAISPFDPNNIIKQITLFNEQETEI